MEIKAILEKTVNPTRKDWSCRLEDALRAYRTAFKMPIEMSPYRLVFGKMCHLPVGVEHQAYWAVNEMNMNTEAGAAQRRMQLQELEELRPDAYDSAMWYNENTKMWHDKNLRKKELKVGQKVLLFHSRLKLMPGKRRSRWIGLHHCRHPNECSNQTPGERSRFAFLNVNGHRVKPYREGMETFVVDDIPLLMPNSRQ
ncbi:uncharacterized protein LOC121757478 [Salvia splendens]|uniref:uncharacterized protein LOC121757478 n=1 Tax=Salvia splendens TaxID=180675 RepID=UPI001C2639BC|nr:uncharacterized protein LOC121757478 [Salvia splendens]